MDLGNVYGFNVLVIILNTIIALIIALAAGKAHEVIHAMRAKQLGYKVNKITLWKNETDIAIADDDPNVRRIAMAPYYVMLPLGFILIVFGYYLLTIQSMFFLGIMIAGIAIVFLHLLSMKFEGKDLNETTFKKEE